MSVVIRCDKCLATIPLLEKEKRKILQDELNGDYKNHYCTRCAFGILNPPTPKFIIGDDESDKYSDWCP